MLGIILKDYYESFCIKKNLIGMLFALLCLVFIVAFMRNLYAYVLIVGITLPLMGVSTLQYSMEQDDISHFDKMLLTFPLSKKQIVKSKLLATLLLTFISLIGISFPIMLIYVFAYQTVSFSMGFNVWLMSIVISLVWNAINAVGFFWLGNKKGTILYMIILIIFAGSYVFVNIAFDLEVILSLSSGVLFVGGMIIALLLNYLSYLGCVWIYTKKHS